MPKLSAAEKAAINRYVHAFGRVGNDLHASTFRAALRDARQLAGRDLDAGMIRSDPVAVRPYAHMYLILMEQVGKVICPTPGPHGAGNDLRAALARFDSGLDARDRDMLYALRCAFGHEFALANEGRKKGQPDALRHRFTLAESSMPMLVKYNGEWNGEYGLAAVGGPTEVNLTELANVVERVVSDIEARCASGELRLVEGVDPEMVLSRWGFRVLNANA